MTSGRAAAAALMLVLTAGCSALRGDPEHAYDTDHRASDEMAPANPHRGTKTLRVTTHTPPELTVRLVTYYSQFTLTPGGSATRRSAVLHDSCWWAQWAVLQEIYHYYHRVFYYPVGPGTHVMDLLLDEVVPGTCDIAITGIGHEVTYRPPGGGAVSRSYVRNDIVASEAGGESPTDATIVCKLDALTQPGRPSPWLRCRRDPARSRLHGAVPVSGGEITLDFRLERLAASQPN